MLKIFDYKCPSCGLIEERMVKASAKDEQRCKDCTHPLERLVAAPKGKGDCAHGYLKKTGGFN